MEENFIQQPTSIIKIAMYGPESTGKTTLSKQLAAHYKDEWVPEFARDFLQEKFNKSKEICSEADLIPIALGQIKLENEAAKKAKKILFCDTNLLVTKVFSEVYYHRCDSKIAEAAKVHQYDLVFLSDIDVPWEADDLRDGPTNRAHVFETFENAIISNGNPYIKLEGDQTTRLQKATKIIDELILAKQLGFTSADYVTIFHKKIAVANLQKQFHFLKQGISKVNLLRSAVKNDGILSCTSNEISEYVQFFDENSTKIEVEKFVPASGAASRMFLFLSEFLNNYEIEKESINAYINLNQCVELSVFLAGLKSFPFYKDLKTAAVKMHSNFFDTTPDERNYLLIKTLLDPGLFDFSNKPKGILPFHQSEDRIISPIEEHLEESIFTESSTRKAKIHFTVSPEHKSAFEEITKTYNNVVVSFSFQQESTETVAVDANNVPLRNEKGALVFRPGGHGALIENLNQLSSDLIFIKNIDNVSQNNTTEIVKFKKLLGGILLQLQQQIFSYLKELDHDAVCPERVKEIKEFAQKALAINFSKDFDSISKFMQVDCLKNELNRPIRVCGMVKNEGEPGGGPFWIQDDSGKISLQIIELSQIDLSNENHLQIVKNATHFNPVDLVCGIKNYRGEKFDLSQYVDQNAGFVVSKNKNGKPYKAYELPGLWNGGMANWLTLFVEVPLLTFNPVKTVNDLLKPAHQPQNNG